MTTRIRRLIVGSAAGVAALTFGAALAQPASADGLRNTTRSSTGAFLQSSGYCGHPFEFTITSRGFEWLQVGVTTSAGTTWGAWTRVQPDASFTYELPRQYQNKTYVIRGADWVGGRWEIAQVFTWFDRISNGDSYGTWHC